MNERPQTSEAGFLPEGEVHSYESYLAQYGSLTYRNKGVSMLPLLKEGRDLFTVEPRPEARCRKYDVVLYRRPPDQYVLHRIIRVRDRDYVILGDNCVNREYGVTDDDIVGVMTSFVRKGRTYSVEDWRYRLYSRVLCALQPLRILLYRVKRFVRKRLK